MTYEFKFEQPFLNLILRGLAKLPFEESVQAIQALQVEVQKQDAAHAKADEAVKRADDSITADAKKKPGRPPKANGAAEQPQVST